MGGPGPIGFSVPLVFPFREEKKHSFCIIGLVLFPQTRSCVVCGVVWYCIVLACVLLSMFGAYLTIRRLNLRQDHHHGADKMKESHDDEELGGTTSTLVLFGHKVCNGK
jgi:hypothetical protein